MNENERFAVINLLARRAEYLIHELASMDTGFNENRFAALVDHLNAVLDLKAKLESTRE